MTDQRLIKEMQQNNMVAFGELYRRHHDYLVSFASLNVGKMNIAEDIVHDVFIKLWQNKGNIEPVDSLRPYLLRAVHNNSLNILRNESKCLGFRNEYVEKIERAASSIYNPDKNEVIKSLYVKDAQKRIEEAVNMLPERCRLIFRMYYIEGYPHKDISTKLGISVRTVENQIYKAVKFMREHLPEEIFTFLLLSGNFNCLS